MRPLSLGLRYFVLASALIALAGPSWAIVSGQLDTFEDGTTMGWQEGTLSPNQPFNVADGGPNGAGDGYMQDSSAGGFGAGSNMTVFNAMQWTGDWITPGIFRVEMDMINLGDTALSMRIGFEGSFTRWVSTTPFALPAGGQWTHVGFDIDAASLTRVAGASSLETTLASISQFRVLHNPIVSFNGSSIVATIGLDNIQAFGTAPTGSGRVPNGADDAPGIPLTVSRTAEGLRLDWGASCNQDDTDFAVYEGSLGTTDSAVPVTCTTGGETFADIVPSSGSRFYLVVPRSDAIEGSYGTDSNGVERAPSSGACVPQAVAVCE